MFCAQCGQRVADGSKFCNQCGAPVVAMPATATRGLTGAVAIAPAPTSGEDADPMPRPVRSAASSSGAGAGRAGSNFDADKAATEASELARGIFARARNILLTPSTEWPVIAAEPSSSSAIYLRYVAPLVAIGVIATFLGQTLVGTSAGPLGMVRVGIFAGLMHAILLFGLSFLQVFLISWLVDVLAPSFGGQPNSLAALKVTAYSFTPGWVAAVLNVVPVLGVIGVLAALYGLYLLYLGLPVLMRSPKDRSVGYTVVLVICAVVLSVLVTTLSTCAVAGLDFLGLGAMARHGGVSNPATAKTDTAGVLANIFGGKSDAAAMNAVGQIMAGGKDVQPVDFHELKAMLPASLPGMQRNEASGQGGEAMGMKGSSATARYSDGANGSIRIEIVDLGSMAGVAALAGKFDPNIEKETDTGYERTKRIEGQLVHERYDRRAKSGEIGVLVANRFSVTVEGSGIDAAALTGALKTIDLSSLASMTTVAAKK